MSYLNQLLEVLENIPNKVTNSLNEIRKLDEESKKFSLIINQEGIQLINDIKNCEDSSNINEIEKRIELYNQNKELLEQMIQKQQKVANELYNSLDDCIKKYDQENENLKILLPHSTSKQSKGDQGSRENKKRKADDIESKLGFLVNPETIEEIADPMEPKYCFCRRISFGQMIGCDNEDCPIEWFHFECVGLHPSTPQPKEWYCSEKCKLEAKAHTKEL